MMQFCVCEWNYLIDRQLVFLLEHVSAGNIRSVEFHCCMRVFLFHLSWRHQFILFYIRLKFWRGLKTILRSKRGEWWKYAKTRFAVLTILSGDYLRQKIGVYLHLFDILLPTLGVTWCWGIIGWFWILCFYNGLRWMWLVLTLSTFYCHYYFPIFTHGSLQYCSDEIASRAFTQEKRKIGYKGVLSYQNEAMSVGLNICLTDGRKHLCK